MGIFDWLFGKKETPSETKKEDDKIKKKDNSDDLVLRVNWNETEDVGIITHYKGKPITGICYRLDENGKLQGECEMKNGLKHGLLKKYQENGELERVITFKEDHPIKTDWKIKLKNSPLPFDFSGTLYKEGSSVLSPDKSLYFLDNEQLSIYDLLRGDLIKSKMENKEYNYEKLKDYYLWFKNSDEEKFKILFPNIIIDTNGNVKNNDNSSREEIKSTKKDDNLNEIHSQKNTIIEKEKLFEKFEDISGLQLSEIEFIDFEGQTWRDSKYSSFIELFEDNKDFEYYFIVVDNTQGGYYQLKKTDLNKRSEKISQYDYDTDFGDLEENFDETNEVIEDVWCDVIIYKINSDKFSSLLQNLINEFSNSDDNEFYEWLFDGEWVPSYELPETLINKLGLNSDVLEHLFEKGLEIDSVEKIKQNPFVINCGNTYGDRTQECFLGIKK
tara:strand:- start:880 stop:2208 length:1329 start_codon:yes stop_codon:yes gene_type:complete